MKHFNLYKKIRTLYPNLKECDFYPNQGCITLFNDGDGEGDYINKWTHSTLSQPTDEEIENVMIDETLFDQPPTPQQKLEQAGLTVEELKELLGL